MAGRHDWCQWQGNLVPHTASGVLVHKGAGETGNAGVVMVHHPARMKHDAGEGGSLVKGHAVEVDGHEPGCNLVVGNLPGHVALYQELQLLTAQFLSLRLQRTASFFHDDVNSTERHVFLPNI